MIHFRRALALVLLMVSATFSSVVTASAEPVSVDLNLVIAVDCSLSVDNTEYTLQRQGLANAFRDAEIIKRLSSGPAGRIAVTVVQWSSSDNQVVAVPWFMVDGALSAEVLATTIESMPRKSSDGGTSISAMIDKGAALISTSPFEAERNVIDIQADGTNNDGGDIDQARDRALAIGITINGLAIVNEISWLNLYFRNHIVGGVGAFIEIATNYEAYATAIRKKLLREIAPPILSRLEPIDPHQRTL